MKKAIAKTRYWLPLLVGAIFIGFLGFSIMSLWCGLSRSPSPDQYDPWRGSKMDIHREVRDLAPSYTPLWTPDGERIIFGVGRGFHYGEGPPNPSLPEAEVYMGSIYMATAGGGQVDRLSEVRGPVELDSSPDLSPDGSRLVQVTSRYYDEEPLTGIRRNFEIEVSHSDGSDRIRLTKDPHTDTYPKWLPDGNRVAFVKRNDYREDIDEEYEGSHYDHYGQGEFYYVVDSIYTVRADGSDLRLVYPTGEHIKRHQPFTPFEIVESPVWSPDGRLLAFKTHYAHLYVNDSGDTTLYESLYVMEQDGSGLTELLRADRSTGSLVAGPFVWSPDGQEITFVQLQRAPQGHGIDLFAIALDGSEREIGNLGKGMEIDAITNVEWSSSSEQVLISTIPRASSGAVFIVDVNGAGNIMIEGLGSYAAWSPDGSRIAVLDGYHLPPTEGYQPHRIVRLSTMAPDGSDYRLILEAKVVEHPN